MRVCMIGYAFYESDARLIQYATSLTGRGDTVDVICLRHPGQCSSERVDGVNVCRIQTRQVNERGQFAYLFRVVRFLLHSAVVVARRHSAKHYDLLHVHSVPDFLVFAALLPKILGAAVILDIHDILPELYCSKFAARRGSWVFHMLVLVERISILSADHVVVANDLWKPRLVQRSCAAEKCTAICNYPDPHTFHPRPRRLGMDRFVILYPGSLNWHQGVDIAIRAFARAGTEMSDAEFHIYGDGPEKPHLMALATELGLNGRVKFRSTVPHGEIAEVMAQADLGVVPKRASSEFGNEAISTKVLHFMAVGVPVIVSRTAVDTHYHDDSRVWFVESDNVAELSQAMVTLRRDAHLRASLASAGLTYTGENNWMARKAEYLRLVDRLCGVPSAAGRGQQAAV